MNWKSPLEGYFFQLQVCIFRTKKKGWGLKTLDSIRANQFVTEYVGEILTSEDAETRGKKYDKMGQTYLFDLDYNEDDCLYTIDAYRFGNVAHFINHSVSFYHYAKPNSYHV